MSNNYLSLFNWFANQTDPIFYLAYNLNLKVN